MPIIHEQDGFSFQIEPDYKEPPHVRITKGKGLIIIRIGIPEKELPYIEKYENVSHDEVDLAFNIISDGQEKFLTLWARIHKQSKKSVLMAIVPHRMVVFKGKQIRRTFHNGEWFFVLVDIVEALTDTVNASDYLKKMRSRDPGLNEGWGQIVTTLEIETTKGKQKLNCVNTEGAFRIIQSIPSPKAEPFKRWLAKVGYERIQEIEDPELATKRTRALYKAKGYPDAWIEKRMRAIAIREELTDEWNDRGIKEQKEYAILTAEISKAAFGVTPSQYKKIKGLDHENLRDHMNDLELIFSMLGEASTTEIARTKDAQGFVENKKAAREGGQVAGNARRDLEKKSGQKVISSQNFLPASRKKKQILLKKGNRAQRNRKLG